MSLNIFHGESMGSGFSIVAGYIFGGNTKKYAVWMTRNEVLVEIK